MTPSLRFILKQYCVQITAFTLLFTHFWFHNVRRQKRFHLDLDVYPDPEFAINSSLAIKKKMVTKFIAISDINYAEVALYWHKQVVSLGYPSDQVVVVAADDATLDYFENKNVNAEPMLHPESEGWPVSHALSRPQTNRRRIFASRWIYVLHQLRHGYSVLLSDADNLFLRHLPLVELEQSGYDVMHAYCYNFPTEYLDMGFVVCGGMMWLRGNEFLGGSEEDGPAAKYVNEILHSCRWPSTDEVQNKTDSKNAIDEGAGSFNNIYPPPLKSGAAYCDDQVKINSMFFESKKFPILWESRPNDNFWKQEVIYFNI